MRTANKILNRPQIAELSKKLYDAAQIFGGDVVEDAVSGMQQVKLVHLNPDGTVGWSESPYPPQEARKLNEMFHEAIGNLGQTIQSESLLNGDKFSDKIWDSWNAAEITHLNVPQSKDSMIPDDHKMQMYQKFKSLAEGMFGHVEQASQSRGSSL